MSQRSDATLKSGVLLRIHSRRYLYSCDDRGIWVENEAHTDLELHVSTEPGYDGENVEYGGVAISSFNPSLLRQLSFQR